MGLLVIKDGCEFGSYSIPEISLFLNTGRLNPKDLVRLNGIDVPLSTIPELQSFVSNLPPANENGATIGANTNSSRTGGMDPSRSPIYTRIRGAIQEEVEAFLKPFTPGPEEPLGIQSLRSTGFFTDFVNQTNVFTDNCCQKLVKIIRAESLIPTVRASPTPDLAKRIRDTAFRKLDGVLVRYAALAKRIQVIDANLKAIQEALHKPSDSTGAQPSTPESEGNKAWATSERMERECALLAQAKVNAVSRIREYLLTIESFPPAAMEYGCDKCFAAETDFEFMNQEIAEIQDSMRIPLTRARESFDRVLEAEKQNLNHHTTIVTNAHEQTYLNQVLEKMVENRLEKKMSAERRFKKLIIWIFVLYVLATTVSFFVLRQ